MEPDGRRAKCIAESLVHILDLSNPSNSFILPPEPEIHWYPHRLKSAGLNYVVSNDAYMEIWNAAPQVYEQIATMIATWSDEKSESPFAEHCRRYQDYLFNRLPREVRAFIEEYEDKKTGLIAYFKRACVPEIVECMERTLIAQENQTEGEFTTHTDSVLKWVKNCRLEETSEW